MSKTTTAQSYAETYRGKGWIAFPLPAGAKFPPATGVTGHRTEPEARRAAVEAWTTAEDGDNVGLRVPDNVIVIDVDTYGDKPGIDTIKALEADLGELPATYMSSRRGDPLTSGHRFYRVPSGTRVGDKTGPGVDIVQACHRYSVVAPSVVDGKPYRWFSPEGQPCAEVPAVDALAELPSAWVEHLQAGYTERPNIEDLPVSEAIEWLTAISFDPHGPGYATVSFDDEGGRQPALRRMALELVNGAVAGHRGILSDLDALAEAYRLAIGHDRGSQAVEREIESAVGSAVARVQADINAGKISLRDWSFIDDLGDLSGLADRVSELLKPDPLDVFTDLSDFITGDYEPPRRELGRFADGSPLLPRGKRVSIFGESGKGKTWVVEALTAQVLADGGRVVYIDLEQGAAPTVNNLKSLGCTPQHLSRLHFAEPNEWKTVTGKILPAIEALRPDLVVLDSFGQALTMSGGESDSVDAVNTVDQSFSRPVVATGATLVALDHVTKSTTNPGYALGSQGKRGNFDLPLRLVSTSTPIDRGQDGKVILAVAKDREGIWSDLGTRDYDETGQIRPAVDFYLSADNRARFEPSAGWEGQPAEGHPGAGQNMERAVMQAVTRKAYRNAYEIAPETGPSQDYESVAWRSELDQRDLWPTSKSKVIELIEAEATGNGLTYSKREMERMCDEWFNSVGNGRNARRVPRRSPSEVAPSEAVRWGGM